jgi:ABC-type sugar transport system ATPase subunit
MPIAVEASELTKAYAGELALDRASISIASGEVHGLVGENGAGKSTLIKVLAGAVDADGGTVRIEGETVKIRNNADARGYGLHFVHQDLGLVERLDVAQNVFLGQPPFGAGPFFSRRATRREAARVLEGFTDVDPSARVGDLSVAERWMVAIARACHGDARLVVMDEPTVALSSKETTLVFSAIERLKARGVSVLFVTHRLAEVLQICDRVTVMKDAQTTGSHMIGELDRDRLVSLIVGEMKASDAPSIEAATAGPAAGPIVLETRGLRGGPVRGVDLQLREGEILGIGGLVGSGRSSLLQMLFAAHRPTGGEIFFAGERVKWSSPGGAVRSGVAMIPEDRRANGLLARRSIRENVVLAHLDKCNGSSRLPIPSRRRELDYANAQIEGLRIACSGPEQRVGALSGGNQQKVLLGRWLISPDLRVLLLDEPTKGIDVGAKAELFERIGDLTAKGVAVVFVSSDLEEVAEISSRIIVLAEGRVVAELNRPASEADILGAAYNAQTAAV